VADELRRVLEGADMSGLTAAQLDHLERVLSGGLSAALAEQQRRHAQVREWRARDPGRVRDGSWNPRWVDHPSKLVARETGEVSYRSEPCQLSREALRELVALLDEGWSVRVSGDSDHFPGRTVSVLVRPATKRKGAAAIEFHGDLARQKPTGSAAGNLSDHLVAGKLAVGNASHRHVRTLETGATLSNAVAGNGRQRGPAALRARTPVARGHLTPEPDRASETTDA
jgi:hypothetical protein